MREAIAPDDHCTVELIASRSRSGGIIKRVFAAFAKQLREEVDRG